MPSRSLVLQGTLPVPAPTHPHPTRGRSHLEATYELDETREDLALLRQQAHSDAQAGLSVPAIPGPEAGKEAVVAAAVASCEAQMDGDRKTTALKSLQVGRGARAGRPGVLLATQDVAFLRCHKVSPSLTACLLLTCLPACPPQSLRLPSCFLPTCQGHIWAGGFARGELKGELFRDVPDALAQWRAAGIKTYIYSSGSRGAQVGGTRWQLGRWRAATCGWCSVGRHHWRPGGKPRLDFVAAHTLPSCRPRPAARPAGPHHRGRPAALPLWLLRYHVWAKG